MKVFISIKYYPDNHNRPEIEAISAALEKSGVETICIVRDLEEWGRQSFSPKVLMQKTFDAIADCDLLITECSEKGIGLGIEAGYAHAKLKPVLLLAREGIEISTTLEGISSQIIRYEHIEEFQGIFSEIFAR